MSGGRPAVASAARVALAQLPGAVSSFTGRGDHLHQLDVALGVPAEQVPTELEYL